MLKDKKEAMVQLSKIMRDHAVPMANRISARSKFDALLEEACEEFQGFLAKLKAELQETIPESI